MKKIVFAAFLLSFSSLNAFAIVACKIEPTTQDAQKTADFLNSYCDTTKPYSVSQVIETYQASHWTQSIGTKICCTKL